MATGARQDELLQARRDDVDHDRRQLTLTGKRGKRRTIALDPFDGYDLLRALPAYVGSPLLFWHGSGEPYRNFSSQFAAIVSRTAAGRRPTGRTSARSGTTIYGTGMPCIGSNRAARSTSYSTGSAIPA